MPLNSSSAMYEHVGSSRADVASFLNTSGDRADCLRINTTPGGVLSVEGDSPFLLAWWIELIYGLWFSCMVFVATVGNAIVVWIILAHGRMRTVTNYFLLNLSVADFMTGTFNTIFNFVYMLESHWAFGKSYCVFNNFTSNLTVASSAFTMAAMSVDRYFAIVRPLCPRLPRWLAACVIVCIWASSALLSVPTLLYSTTTSYNYSGNMRIVCWMIWPDTQEYRSFSEYVYNIVFLVLTYVVPVVIMGVAYSRMGVVLWGSRCIGEETDRQQNALRAKRKVVRMLITVVTLFTICWLPYHIYFLYVYHFPDVTETDYIQHVYLAMYWMAMSHSMYNPLVYYWMNRRFRGYFRKALCFWTSEPDDTKALYANGRDVKHRQSWTERQHTLRISLWSRTSYLDKDIGVNANYRQESSEV